MAKNSDDREPSPDRLADEAKWRALLESAGLRAEALGLTEDDVPRLIAEVRRERDPG
jgi:hypothetical protein